MTKEDIIAYAREIEDSIRRNLVEKLDVVNGGFKSDLQHHVRQLENRSKEYHHPSFVVLVVGPVKSGKSTFVNLVAKNYVSPTHFLECTVRPSIISKKEGDSYLEVYESCDPERKSEQMDDILDFLNGLIEKHEIKDVEVHQREFSRGNIDKYVKRSMVELQNDEILLTAIHTEGGKLLQDNVLLVDMAGFDGANANFESPAYKAIVERADLIIFVQSSNSAISKVSSEFFDLLRKTNCSVPVCLVHNVFEAAYWRTDELKRRDIEMQKEHAIDVIRDTYKLTLETNNAFNLNLGKVNDLREKNYEEKDEAILSAEAVEFEKAEEEMYRLFEKRECIRLKNCITRVRIHKEKLLGVITNLQNEQDKLRETFDAIRTEFTNLKKTESDIPLTIGVPISLDELKNIVNQAYYAIKQIDVTSPKYKTDEARAIVQKFVDRVESDVNAYLHSKLDEVRAVETSEELQQWLAGINKTALGYGVMGIADVTSQIEKKSVTYDLGTSVESKVHRKPLAYKHSIEEVNEYLNVFKNLLLGFQPEHTMVMVPGYIEKIYDEIQGIINDSIVKAKSSVISLVNKEIDKRKSEVLTTVIPDVETFDKDNAILRAYKQSVENINIMDIA